MNIAENITQTIGNTPLLKLSRFAPEYNILAKLEFFNPGGSIKDRVALRMIRKAEERGTIHPGSTLIEATSGNTGIALAMIAAAKGYRMIIVMPENMTAERRKLIKHFGAELVLTPEGEGVAGSVKKAQELNAQIPDSLIVNQFSNPDNPDCAYSHTAIEILHQTDNYVDYFVAAVGTGGSLTGTGLSLKKRLPHLHVVAVEPASCAVLSGGKPGPHKIQGIGTGFIPKVLDQTSYDRVIPVSDKDAIETARQLALKEGILCGISAGANVFASLQIAKEFPKAQIVTLIPDTGERYLSTELFD